MESHQLRYILQNACCPAVPLIATGSSYKPKDVLVLRHYKQCSNADGHIAACSTSSSSGGGGDSRGLKARYLEGTFGHHLTERSWDVEAETLKL